MSWAICMMLRAIISSSLPGEGEAYLQVISVDDEPDGSLAAFGPHPNQKLAEGTPEQIEANDQVQLIYTLSRQ